MILPLALPGLAAAAIFVFIISWNDVFAASVLTLRHRTLPAQVLTASGEAPLPYRVAGGFFLLAPSLIVIFFIRKYLFNMWGRVTRGRWQASASSAISKTFGKVIATNDVSLTVADGEFIVLLGPSGCGKTTLLRCLAGLEQVDAGRILIGERDVTDLPPGRRRIAMVFQSYAVFPHMTLYDNIAFGLKMQKESKATIKERVDSVAELVHIEELLERYPAQISGGQRQRVAARARDRDEGRRAADGRAALEPRRAAAHGDARRAEGAAAPARHDDDLRHARPGRGAEHGRPHRRDEGRHHRPGRHAARRLRPPGRHLRRRLRRDAADELPRRRGDVERAARRSSQLSGGSFPLAGVTARALAGKRAHARHPRRGDPRAHRRDRGAACRRR